MSLAVTVNENCFILVFFKQNSLSASYHPLQGLVLLASNLAHVAFLVFSVAGEKIHWKQMG